MNTPTKTPLLHGQHKIDETQWACLRLNVPLVRPRYAQRPEAAEIRPGSCVKSLRRESPTGFPLLHGVLVSAGDALDNEYTHYVIGHGLIEAEGKFVWRGNVRDFERTWQID